MFAYILPGVLAVGLLFMLMGMRSMWSESPLEAPVEQVEVPVDDDQQPTPVRLHYELPEGRGEVVVLIWNTYGNRVMKTVGCDQPITQRWTVCVTRGDEEEIVTRESRGYLQLDGQGMIRGKRLTDGAGFDARHFLRRLGVESFGLWSWQIELESVRSA
jgi:hypothetical protein